MPAGGPEPLTHTGLKGWERRHPTATNVIVVGAVGLFGFFFFALVFSCIVGDDPSQRTDNYAPVAQPVQRHCGVVNSDRGRADYSLESRPARSIEMADGLIGPLARWCIPGADQRRATINGTMISSGVRPPWSATFRRPLSWVRW